MKVVHTIPASSIFLVNYFEDYLLGLSFSILIGLIKFDNCCYVFNLSMLKVLGRFD